MTPFLKVFLRDRLRQLAQLAAFGKHPAWNDHIDDVGLTTETLVITKRILYSEGIASQLSSGAWNRLEETGQILEFDHRFVWSREAQSVIGGIWTSRDGKGRTHFPMIVCLQIGVRGCQAIHRFVPLVENLGVLCHLAKDRQKFRDVFAEAQLRLDSPALSNSHSETEPSNISGPKEESILNGMAALSQGIRKYRKQGVREGIRNVHFRLPAISSRPKESLEFWVGYLETRLDFRLPCLTIASAGPGPIDVIAGEPGANNLFCLRATEAALPMTPASVVDKPSADVRLEAKVYLRSFEQGSVSSPDRWLAGWWRLSK
jgi:hypothetical protein